MEEIVQFQCQVKAGMSCTIHDGTQTIVDVVLVAFQKYSQNKTFCVVTCSAIRS